MWAPRRLDWDSHRACRTIFRDRLSVWSRSLHLVDCFHDKEDTERDNGEVNHKSDKITVIPGDRLVSQCVGWSREISRPSTPAFRTTNLFEKSRPPVTKPIGGMRTSFTS